MDDVREEPDENGFYFIFEPSVSDEGVRTMSDDFFRNISCDGCQEEWIRFKNYTLGAELGTSQIRFRFYEHVNGQKFFEVEFFNTSLNAPVDDPYHVDVYGESQGPTFAVTYNDIVTLFTRLKEENITLYW